MHFYCQTKAVQYLGGLWQTCGYGDKKKHLLWGIDALRMNEARYIFNNTANISIILIHNHNALLKFALYDYPLDIGTPINLLSEHIL